MNNCPMSVFDEQYARYYDLLYADKDYAAEADYIAELIRARNPSAITILELGCGTGRHAELLGRRGFILHGIDRSEQMVRRAIRRASLSAGLQNTLTFAVADVTDFRSSSRFDAVISLFHVVSYQTANSAVSRMFSVAAEHLSAGGIFIFDVWYGPAVLEQKPSIRVKRLADANGRITRIAEPLLNPNKNIVEVHYSIQCVATDSVQARDSGQVHEFVETHKVRYFFLPELELMLGQAGFWLEKAEEWLTGTTPSPATWGVTIVARKR